MADGAVTVTLTFEGEIADELRAEAVARGVSLETVTSERVTSVVWTPQDAADWEEDERRLAECERTGETHDLEDVLKEFRERVESGLRAKAR
jgi:hypothetical protein